MGKMKLIGQYTVRGRLTENETEQVGAHQIPLFDGRFDTGYRVTKFYIWPSSFSATTTSDLVGKLATEPGLNDTAPGFFAADDVREIAWAGTGSDAIDTWSQSQNAIIDPENLVIEDLFVYVRGAQDAAPANYMIVMEKYEINEWLGGGVMARNLAQADSLD